MIATNMHPELVGCTTELMLYPDGSSGARVQMQGAHYQQAPVIVGNQKRNLFTGSEFEYANYVFNVIVEHECKIERVIRRNAKREMNDRRAVETVLFVSYTSDDVVRSTVYDVIVIPAYQSHHQYFGYQLIPTPIFYSILRGDTKMLRKGTILAQTPGVIDDEWCLGRNVPAILASHQLVIEDACWISQELADSLKSYGYKTHVFSFGAKDYPLFLYGDADNPRIHPDLGEKVRADGMLMAKREYDELLSAVEMTSQALMEPDGHFDECVVTDPGAEVVDIKVYRDDSSRNKMQTPVAMQKVCDEYADGLSLFHGDVRQFYQKLKMDRKKPNLTPKARQLIREAIYDNPRDLIKNEGPRKKQFGYEVLEDYRIEITVRFPIELDVAGKITDCFGGKGVVGRVMPTEDMPIDQYGNRVHIVMSDNAMLRRTNWNRGFEHYINAARRDCQLDTLALADKGDYAGAWDYVTGFMEVCSPKWATAIRDTHPDAKTQHDFIDELRNEPLRIWFPVDNELGMMEVESAVKAKYPPRQSKLTVTDENGNKKLTVEEFIVGELYVIRLDKTGRDFSAISAGKYQHFGTITKQHSRDRNRRAVREHPIKFMGESEARHLKAYIGGDVAEEIHDRSNNPVVADEVILSVLTAEQPTNIPEAVDRDRFPLGNNRSMAILNHVLECEGVAFTTGE